MPHGLAEELRSEPVRQMAWTNSLWYRSAMDEASESIRWWTQIILGANVINLFAALSYKIL